MFKVKLLTKNAIPPKKAHPNDAGYDVYANEDLIIYSLDSAVVNTGIAIQIQPEFDTPFYIRVAPRSGLASKNGINVLGGVIDSCYTGPCKVILHNTSKVAFKVNKGDRIAQLIPTPILQINELEIVKDLDSTERNQDGFGSSGK